MKKTQKQKNNIIIIINKTKARINQRDKKKTTG